LRGFYANPPLPIASKWTSYFAAIGGIPLKQLAFVVIVITLLLAISSSAAEPIPGLTAFLNGVL